MVKRAKKKRGSKPPVRRVPPGENRTARNFAIAVAVSKEEKAAVKAAAVALGFKTPSALMAYIVANIFEMAQNPLHAAAFEADVVGRVSKVSGAVPREPYAAVMNADFLTEFSGKIEVSLKKSFGETEKRELVVSALSTSISGGDHDP